MDLPLGLVQLVGTPSDKVTTLGDVPFVSPVASIVTSVHPGAAGVHFPVSDRVSVGRLLLPH